jgi:hypothetical protein
MKVVRFILCVVVLVGVGLSSVLWFAPNGGQGLIGGVFGIFVGLVVFGVIFAISSGILRKFGP